jgi:hypothetical protein
MLSTVLGIGIVQDIYSYIIIIIIIITPPNRHVIQLEGRKNQNQYINLY